MSSMQSNTERDLQRQLDSERYERQRLEDRLAAFELARDRAEEENRRERTAIRTDYQRSTQRTASTWPQALARQIPLLRAEAHLDYAGDDAGAYFQRSLAACQRALALWREEEAKIADQVATLLARVAELRDGVRFAVADRLEAEGAEETVVRDMRTIAEDEDELSAWLDW